MHIRFRHVQQQHGSQSSRGRGDGAGGCGLHLRPHRLQEEPAGERGPLRRGGVGGAKRRRLGPHGSRATPVEIHRTFSEAVPIARQPPKPSWTIVSVKCCEIIIKCFASAKQTSQG